VVGLHPRARGREVAPPAGLVAEREEEDAGVVLVALDHAADALDVRVGEVFGVRDALSVVRPVAVRLDVGLVLHVEAVLVAERVPALVVRVVARPHGVDVVTLHQDDVFDHHLARRHLPEVGVVLVPVDALDDRGAPVDENLPVPDLARAEAEPPRDDFEPAPF
jgi:hypothetical protein